jgi:predicted transcriptional regulator
MSSRAAWRLETLGFSEVYHYAAGKLDWFAFGLPMAGEFAEIPKAGDVVRRDVPTCELADRLGEVYQRCQAIGSQVCLVVNEQNVVLGRLRREAWNADPHTPVEKVMENGPTTFRPDNFLEPLTRRMREKKVGSAIITNADGILIGILCRRDAEERLRQDQSMHEHVKAIR